MLFCDQYIATLLEIWNILHYSPMEMKPTLKMEELFEIDALLLVISLRRIRGNVKLDVKPMLKKM